MSQQHKHKYRRRQRQQRTEVNEEHEEEIKSDEEVLVDKVNTQVKVYHLVYDMMI